MLRPQVPVCFGFTVVTAFFYISTTQIAIHHSVRQLQKLTTSNMLFYLRNEFAFYS